MIPVERGLAALVAAAGQAPAAAPRPAVPAAVAPDTRAAAAPALLAGATPATDWLVGFDHPAWLVDGRSLQLVQLNEPALAWLGGEPEHWLGRAADEVLPLLEDAAFWSEVRAALRPEARGATPEAAVVWPRLASHTELPRPDGRVAQVSRRVVPLGLEPGAAAPRAWLVTLQDRSAEARAARERDTLLAELRATLEATADGILVLDTAGRIRAFNRRFAALWELPDAALAEKRDGAVLDWMRLAVLDPQAYQQRLDEIGSHLLLTATDTVTLLNGSVIERHTQPQWSAGRPIGRVYSFRPLAGPARAALWNEEGQRGLDDFTGWPNRAAFAQAVDEAVDAARSEDTPLALLCVEFEPEALFALDGQGRARAARELAEGLRASVRDSQLLARFGGGRFAVLLRQVGEAGAEQLAERLVGLSRQGVHGMLVTEGLPIKVGVAVYPQAGRCAHELLTHAEQALQRARMGGGAGWQAHQLAATPMPESRRQLRLEAAVREGLGRESFRLHCQPRVASATGRWQALEVLLRWQDPEDGLLLPAQFLPLADRAGLMTALDDWALAQGLHLAQRWRADGVQLALNVNLGAETLAQPALARRVAALLSAADWPAASLELDITEAALQRDPDAALHNLQALHRLGVRLWLDDWGQGDTALGVLRRYPVHGVKLDRALLRGVPRHADDTALARSLLGMAAALGLERLAEGVETEAQRQFVVAAGCSGWQGVLCAPAREMRNVARTLAVAGQGPWPETPGRVANA